MDLATYPRYMEPLRQEIADVIKEEGMTKNDNGRYIFTKSSIARLKKLDSFIKESERWSPLGYGESLQTRSPPALIGAHHCVNSGFESDSHARRDVVKWAEVTERNYNHLSLTRNPVG